MSCIKEVDIVNVEKEDVYTKEVMVMLGDKYCIPYIKIKNSKLFCSILESQDSLYIPIPDLMVVSDEVIHNYINQDCNSNAEILKLCFEFCHLIDDDVYFAYLMTVLYEWWFNCQQLICQVHDNLRRDIYLHLPLVLIPNDVVLNTPCFIQLWIQTSGHKHFTINKLHYTTEIAYYPNNDTSSTHSQVQTQTQTQTNVLGIKEIQTTTSGDQYINSYDRDSSCNCHSSNQHSRICTLDCKLNYEPHGLSMGWYETGDKEYVKWYLNGKLNGTSVRYYDNGIVSSKWNYLNNNLHGTCQAWYRDNVLMYSQQYDNGKLHGITLKWNGSETYHEQNFYDGRLVYNSQSNYSHAK